MKKRHEQKLTLLSLFLAVAFNVPFLLTYNHTGTIGGIPTPYFVIYTIWLLSVGISYRILAKHYE